MGFWLMQDGSFVAVENGTSRKNHPFYMAVPERPHSYLGQHDEKRHIRPEYMCSMSYGRRIDILSLCMMSFLEICLVLHLWCFQAFIVIGGRFLRSLFQKLAEGRPRVARASLLHIPGAMWELWKLRNKIIFENTIVW